MSRSADELWQALRQARVMPFGAAQIAVIEELTRHADVSGDRELAFAVRMLATSAYTHGGEPVKAFVTFSWCLSDFDRDPAPFHAEHHDDLLWQFKWIVSALTAFPEVPLARTYAVLDDMERRYRENGNSLQAVDKYRGVVADHVGDHARADELHVRWTTAPRDHLSDCSGCDPSAQVLYLVSKGRDAEAIALAEPVLAGHLDCIEQPQDILTELLPAYARTGRTEEAADAHRRAYRKLRGKLADLAAIGDHIAFCARTGNESRGLEILERHLEWMDKAPSPSAGMYFASAAVLLLRRLTALGHGATTVHRREHGDRPAADVPVSVLAEDLFAYTTGLARRFDDRNGTDAASARVHAMISAEPFAETVPLSAAARRKKKAAATVRTPAVAPVPDVPADLDPAALLDLAEEHEQAERESALAAVLAEFDARFGAADVGPSIAGRRADLLAGQRWSARDAAGALAAWERAAELLTEAGDLSAASEATGCGGLVRSLTGDVDAGRALLRQDLAYQEEHRDHLRRLAGARSRLAISHYAQDEFTEALAAQDRADEIAAELGDPRLIARYALRRAHNLVALDRYEDAAVVAGQARDFYREHGPADQLAAAWCVLGQVSPELSDSIAAYDEALATGEPSVALDARMGRGRTLRQLDRPAEAVDDFVEAVAVCAERGLEPGGAFVRQELAAAYQAAGRLAEAAEVAEEAVTAFGRAGLGEAADNAKYLLAGIYREMRDAPAALSLYDDLSTRLAEIGNDAGRGQINEDAADLLFRIDRDAEAAERFTVAAEAYRAAGELPSELRALRRRVTSLHWADDVPAAEEAIRYAGKRHDDLPAEPAGSPVAVWERAMLGFEASRMLMSRGRWSEALPHLSGAPERLRGIGATDDADQVEGTLGEALLRSGDPVAAEALLRRLVTSMTPDAPTRQVAVTVLAESLEALDRGPEAQALRTEHGIDPTDR